MLENHKLMGCKRTIKLIWSIHIGVTDKGTVIELDLSP